MYWVQDNTRYPFNTSGLENSFLGLKASRQNSSNDCFLLIGCVAIPFLLRQMTWAFCSRVKSSPVKPSSRRNTSWLS